MSACEHCLARAWLLGRLAPHLDCVRDRIEPLLALGDDELIKAVGGKDRGAVEDEVVRFDPDRAREAAHAAGVQLLCRCQSGYPPALLALPSPPAVLHVAGGLERFRSLMAAEAVAIVGSRKASPYGLEVARSLARGLARAGLTVLSGMALGVDSAAHAGALAAGAPTLAVLPASPDRPYPSSRRNLHRQILASGVALSEIPPGPTVWRWMFPARNRIIAGLAAMTVVVEASMRSGALITTRVARALGRPVGAVPGRVTSPHAAGPNELLASGALLVRGPHDVLDHLFGAGAWAGVEEARAPLKGELSLLLATIADGLDSAGALARAGIPVERGLAALAELELAGYIRRMPGGRFTVVP